MAEREPVQANTGGGEFGNNLTFLGLKLQKTCSFYIILTA